MNRIKQILNKLTTSYSFNMGNVFGIRVDLDWSLLLLVPLVIYNVYDLVGMRHPSLPFPFVLLLSALIGVAFIGSVLVHELAHALMGKKFGVRCHSIKLFVFGGMAKMESGIVTGKSELIISAAGPAMSALIGVICVILFAFDYGEVSNVPLYGYVATAAIYLAEINIMLAIFNLIPAFPLDGGRMLRAGIWMATKNFRKATKIATKVGNGFANGFIFTGFLMAAGINVPFFGTGFAGGIVLAIIGMMLKRWINMELARLYA